MIDPEGPTLSRTGFDSIYCVMQQICVQVALKFLHDMYIFAESGHLKTKYFHV
jgi:hypothetical protein